MMAILNRRLNKLSLFEGFRGSSWFSLGVQDSGLAKNLVIKRIANKTAINKIGSIVLKIQGPVYSPLTYQTKIRKTANVAGRCIRE